MINMMNMRVYPAKNDVNVINNSVSSDCDDVVISWLKYSDGMLGHCDCDSQRVLTLIGMINTTAHENFQVQNCHHHVAPLFTRCHIPNTIHLRRSIPTDI